MYFFFYYPIGADTDEEGRIWATWFLTACMIAMTCYFRFFPSQALFQWRWWTYFPQEGLSPGLFFSIFNHANWLHLAGNLAYLWVFGPSLERALGAGRALLAFAFLGVFGNLGQAMFSRFIMPELAGYGIVGASGAISGLLGLFLLRFPSSRIRTVWVIFSPLHGMVKSGLLRIPSSLAILSWIGFQVIAVSTALLGSHGSTAYGAHLGGLLGGLLLGIGMGLHRSGRSYRHRSQARLRFERSDYFGAYEAIQPLLDSADPEDLTLAARASRLIGNGNQAMVLYRRAIEGSLRVRDEAGGAAAYAEALRFHPQLSFSETLQSRLISGLEGLGLETAAIQAIRLYRDLYQESPRLSVLLLKAARLEESIDPASARSLYEEHLRRFPDSPFEVLATRALKQLGPA